MNTLDSIQQFEEEQRENVRQLGMNNNIKNIGLQFSIEADKSRYLYNFNWLGRPILQFPQDIMALQELIWEVKPEVIVDVGIAHGGSLIFSASMLELIGRGEVIGVDIDIRSHNRKAIEEHFLSKRIKLIEGSSTEDTVVEAVKEFIGSKSPVLISLDSNHSHEHVLKELQLYSPLVTRDSYLIVFDTIVELLPAGAVKDRPWDKGNNPMTAVNSFLENTKDFTLVKAVEDKLVITAAPGGYLKRVR